MTAHTAIFIDMLCFSTRDETLYALPETFEGIKKRNSLKLNSCLWQVSHHYSLSVEDHDLIHQQVDDSAAVQAEFKQIWTFTLAARYIFSSLFPLEPTTTETIAETSMIVFGAMAQR